MTCLRLGFYEEAAQALKNVVDNNSESPSALALLGDAYLNLNRKYEARQAYRKALELDPNDVKAKNGLAALDDFGEAVI